MAGGLYNTENTNAYYSLNISGGSSTGKNEWYTMTPYQYTKLYSSWGYSNMFFIYGSNYLGEIGQSSGPLSKYVIRPVVSIKSTVIVTGGNGTGNSPYILANT